MIILSVPSLICKSVDFGEKTGPKIVSLEACIWCSKQPLGTLKNGRLRSPQSVPEAVHLALQFLVRFHGVVQFSLDLAPRRVQPSILLLGIIHLPLQSLDASVGLVHLQKNAPTNTLLRTRQPCFDLETSKRKRKEKGKKKERKKGNRTRRTTIASYCYFH